MSSQFKSNRPSTRQVVQTRAAPRAARPTGQSRGMRLLLALGLAAFALISYFGSRTYNPIVEEEQYVNITAEQEIALGLQAAPQMAQEFGGLEADPQAQAVVDAVGERLVSSSIASQTVYQFSFTLLADDETINAFALPGGPTFITDALFDRLESEGQLAGVLAHEIVHVLARHGAQRIAQQQLTEGLTGAVVLATYDPDNPNSQTTTQVALMIANLVTMKYGREDELQSDTIGVQLMVDAGYDPRAMIDVMEILAAASGGAGPPEFFSTHPDPGNRIALIQQAIDEAYPNGVPEGLTP